ncbi:glycosyltransferase [Algoriphagus chordae]|uniref:Glycosyl transferase family 2 n=1 Tax=Algoriphagus chordae TaxID=237019 RepID=A0A2W7QUZ2_9BACT|nr:glycosyltransferase [Algoriphagus chordae]PZX52084.1 glycosyl transferase family 2 [Algoriphagus chordae]
MKSPLISVVLPVFNQENFIAETIESVLNQTFSDFEFLILDDGSTDNSASIIRDYASKDSRISAFYEDSTGRSNATNNLIAKAKSGWIAFLDADDIMLPERLDKQYSFHLANSIVDVSSCHCYYINASGKQLGIQRHSNLSSVEDCLTKFDSLEFVQCAITGLFSKKEVFGKVGGLNSKYWPCDDFEFFNRLIDHRCVLVIIQEVLMKYRIHASAITVSKPLETFEKIGFVMECITDRRLGKAEISYSEFKMKRDAESFWVKFNRKRYNYAQIFFRNAGIDMMSRNYVKFVVNLLGVCFLSPKYVYDKAVGLVFKSQ